MSDSESYKKCTRGQLGGEERENDTYLSLPTLNRPLKDRARRLIAKIMVAIDSLGQYLSAASGSRCAFDAPRPLKDD